MERTAYIYGLCEQGTNNIRYIGKTVDKCKRLSSHRKNKFKETNYRTTWIKSIHNKGKEIEMIILDEVPENEWKFWEVYYVDLYKSWGFKLTNSAVPGEGPTRRKGYKHTKEAIEKTRLKNLGQKRSQAVKDACRLRVLGTKQSESHILKRAKAHMKSITLFSLDNEPIKTFESIKDCSIYLNCASSSITACLNGNMKTIKKHIIKLTKDVKL